MHCRNIRPAVDFDLSLGLPDDGHFLPYHLRMQ